MRQFSATPKPPTDNPMGQAFADMKEYTNKSTGKEAATTEAKVKAEEEKKIEEEKKTEEDKQGAEDGHREESGGRAMGWKHVAFLVVFGSALVMYFQYEKRNQKRTVVKNHGSTGKPLLGGPFELVDENGKVVKSEDFIGEYVLLYFGFTFCPDICPTELRKMLDTLLMTEEANPNLPKVRPLFISIDPERDTKERLKEYRKEWPHPGMVWLTGDKEALDKVAKAYRVYYSVPTEDERQGDNDYLVDHSIFFYLLNPEGEFLEFFGKNATKEEISGKVIQVLTRDLK